MYVKLFGAHLVGIEGQIIEIEVDISFGFPQYDIVGLPGSALKESKERVRSAIKNSGYAFPNKRITVNLAPAHLRKEGSYFDVAIAIAILIADEQIKLNSTQLKMIQECLLVGELALDGSLRKSEGIFPLVLTAKDHHFKKIYLPAPNIYEATSIEDILSVPVHHLKEMIQMLRFSELELSQHIAKLTTANSVHVLEKCKNYGQPMEDIKGQEHAKRALEIAACGQHHVLMIGPPGSGKTLLAKTLITLLPKLSTEEATEVTKIHSVSGLLEEMKGIVQNRTFRSPHHTVTTIGMIGGGTPIKPGEISKAHHGVLFLDEFLEFKRPVIEALREPLEEGKVTITRSHFQYQFPAQFLLIVAMNPCPCGFYGYETEKRSCTCSSTQIDRYQQKLSGPLYDRLDLHIDVPLISFEELMKPVETIDTTYTTQKIKQRIEVGLDFKKHEGREKPNALLQPKEIMKHCQLTKPAEELLQIAYHELHFSARGYHKLLKIARTIADLNQQEEINEGAIAEAIHYRSLDRKK